MPSDRLYKTGSALSKLCLVYDKHGYPIYPGDLLKTYHFTGARRKRYYLYHIVGEEAGRLFVYHPTFPTLTRATTLQADWTDTTEIIAGHGPGKILDFSHRPRLTR